MAMKFQLTNYSKSGLQFGMAPAFKPQKIY